MYIPTNVPESYNAQWLQAELQRLHEVLLQWESTMMLVPQVRAPSKPIAGMVVYADGDNWNPGAGAGLYSYENDAWRKL